MKSIVGVDTSRTYTTVASLPFSLGTVVQNKDGSKAYRLVQMTVGAAVAGDMLAFSAAGLLDRSIVIAGTTDAAAAGMATVAIAQNSYGWIQVRGANDVAMVTDTNVVAGNVCSLTTNNDIKPATEAELVNDSVIGTALATDTGTALAIGEFLLLCPVV